MEMYGKILIKGNIEIVTGMHIGGNDDTFSMIGAIDSPVVRDSYTMLPIIPGSSIKGKMRSLLSRELDQKMSKIGEESDFILRLFGKANNSKNDKAINSRLKFSDCFIINKEELDDINVKITETKYENTIDRISGVANPRQIERVIRGVKFDFHLIYNVENSEEIMKDFENIKKAITLLENDYLGGHGSRGSGRVKFKDLSANKITDNIEDDKIEEINKIIKEGE